MVFTCLKHLREHQIHTSHSCIMPSSNVRLELCMFLFSPTPKYLPVDQVIADSHSVTNPPSTSEIHQCMHTIRNLLVWMCPKNPVRSHNPQPHNISISSKHNQTNLPLQRSNSLPRNILPKTHHLHPHLLRMFQLPNFTNIRMRCISRSELTIA